MNTKNTTPETKVYPTPATDRYNAAVGASLPVYNDFIAAETERLNKLTLAEVKAEYALLRGWHGKNTTKKDMIPVLAKAAWRDHPLAVAIRALSEAEGVEMNVLRSIGQFRESYANAQQNVKDTAHAVATDGVLSYGPKSLLDITLDLVEAEVMMGLWSSVEFRITREEDPEEPTQALESVVRGAIRSVIGTNGGRSTSATSNLVDATRRDALAKWIDSYGRGIEGLKGLIDQW